MGSRTVGPFIVQLLKVFGVRRRWRVEILPVPNGRRLGRSVRVAGIRFCIVGKEWIAVKIVRGFRGGRRSETGIGENVGELDGFFPTLLMGGGGEDVGEF